MCFLFPVLSRRAEGTAAHRDLLETTRISKCTADTGEMPVDFRFECELASIRKCRTKTPEGWMPLEISVLNHLYL